MALNALGHLITDNLNRSQKGVRYSKGSDIWLSVIKIANRDTLFLEWRAAAMTLESSLMCHSDNCCIPYEYYGTWRGKGGGGRL